MIVYFYSGYQICNANTIKIQEKKNNKYYEEKYIFGQVAAGVVAGGLGGDLIGDAMGKSSKKSNNSPFIESQEKILEGIEQVGKNLQNLNKNLIDVNEKMDFTTKHRKLLNNIDSNVLKGFDELKCLLEDKQSDEKCLSKNGSFSDPFTNYTKKYDKFTNYTKKYQEIKLQLTALNLNNLYSNIIEKIDDDEELNEEDLDSIINALKTKYLIDNEILKVEIDDVVFEPLPEFDIDRLDLEKHTNDTFKTTIMKDYIDSQLGSNPSKIEIRMKRYDFYSKTDESFDYVDKLIIKDDDEDETILGSNSQEYLNDKGKTIFTNILDEYKKENENIIALKKITKRDFSSGIYFMGSNYETREIVTKDEYQIRYKSKYGSRLDSELGSN
jgi:hypothetical protein